MVPPDRAGTLTARAKPSDGPQDPLEPTESRPEQWVRRSTPTIADVAALANVSIATVSKALNGRPGVKATTRDRVLKAADALGFQSNALARSLSDREELHGRPDHERQLRAIYDAGPARRGGHITVRSARRPALRWPR